MHKAAVLVNYNDSLRIVALVKKLLSFDFFQHIVVSDNGSTDEQKGFLDEITEDPCVTILYNKNIGFSGGNNAALEWLKDKNISIVFAINSDVDLEKDLLLASEQYLQEHSDVAIVSAQMFEGDKKKQCYYNFPTVTHAALENLGMTKLFKIKPKVRKEVDGCLFVDYIRASFWGVRYCDFEQIGFFDTEIFLYHEETCVGIKLNRIGKSCVLLKEYSYIHNHIYRKGYKINAYKETYKSLKYIFRHYYKKNRFQMFILAIAFYLGRCLRYMLNIK